ncbi:hypothetical protein [Aquamicrobium zhengzhouense]|uniref:hypothetical protein n=1 Tax=Aquamicrobium zhengzhouense TaxID=2781738 RepID=UPI001AEE634B|nr:hypothetical protein [Aquamicrobium zhengzhouense]
MKVMWRDIITQLARHLNTAVDIVEEWDIDKFAAYQASLGRVLKAEAPRSPRSGR